MKTNEEAAKKGWNMKKKKIALVSVLCYFLFVYSSSILGILYLTVDPITIIFAGLMFLCSIFLAVKVVMNSEDVLFFSVLQGVITILGFILFYYMTVSVRDASPFPFMAGGSVVYFILMLTLNFLLKMLNRLKLNTVFITYGLTLVLFIIASAVQRIFFLSLA